MNLKFANKLIDPQQDDRHNQKKWSELAEKGMELVVCIAAAKRRGINEGVVAPGFKISGLGQLTEMAIKSDGLVTFGA